MDVFLFELFGFYIKNLLLKMADKKVTDTPESSGYEMEIDRWKEDLALARQQVNLEKI